MCRIIEEMRNEERAEGRIEGRAEGRVEAMLDAIKNLVESMGLSVEQAMAALRIPGDEHKKYIDMLGGSHGCTPDV